jgi:hypothetical protein
MSAPENFSAFLSLWKVFIEEVEEDKPITGKQFHTLLKMDCMLSDDYKSLYEIECAEHDALKEEMAKLRAKSDSEPLDGEVFHTESAAAPSPIALVKEEDSCSSMPPLESPVTPAVRETFRGWLEPSPLVVERWLATRNENRPETTSALAAACARVLRDRPLPPLDVNQYLAQPGGEPPEMSREDGFELLKALVAKHGDKYACKPCPPPEENYEDLYD